MESNNSVWNLLNEIGKKQGITEIIINRSDLIFVEHQGELVKLNTKVEPQDLDNFVEEIAHLNQKKFSPEFPIMDGSLPDGSRINVIAKEYAQGGPAVTIRKYLKNIKTFDGAPGIFSLDPKWTKFIKTLVASKCNVMVSGGTGVGKTTFLNLLLQEINPLQRLITIEDTRELNFQLPNVVRLEARTGSFTGGTALAMRDLVKNTLRMRPDRIVIGEVRGGEVFDLLQAMNTGHDGSMASVHANNPGECLNRMENLYLLSGYDVPVRAIRQQIGSAIDFVIQLKRTREGQRVVGQITELAGFEADKILLQDVGVFKEGRLQFTGLVPKRMAKLVDGGLPKDFFVST
ncbi:MAG: Flp pilus assembly complex ATPase component TadA [Bacteriovoracaceae bacterium]|nr:Flp pilus assembly complex ATPase component TadA [Bacteriovoracaceae bacterium]